MSAVAGGGGTAGTSAGGGDGPLRPLSPELLSTVLDVVPVATVVLDPAGRILACNALAESLLRLRARWQGASILEGQDAPLVAAVSRLLGGEPIARETRVRLGDGSVRSLSWKATPLLGPGDERLGAVAVVEDTSRRQAARRDTALLDALFREAPVGLAVFDQRRRFTRVNGALARMHGLPAAEHVGRSLDELLPDLPESLDEVVAEVFATGVPAADLEVTGRTPATGEELRSWLHSVFRLEHGGQAVGVGAVVRDVTDQRRAELERVAAAARLALVARAGELLASTLEPDAVLDLLCHILVPDLADIVVVDLVEEDGRLRRRASRGASGETLARQRPLGEVADYPPDHPVARAAQGRAYVVEDVSAHPDLVPAGKDAAYVRESGVCSVLILPMQVAGRVVGVTSLLFARSGRHYREAEQALARDVVSRAAVAVANALSYERQRSAAVALQRSLLPEVLDDVGGLRVAWRYLPGAAGTQVGGDWVDVLPLPSGRTAVVVGDVMGRGLRAAAVMGQVRTAVRVLARQDPPPGEVLRGVDDAVQDLADGQLVTCTYAVYDPARGILALASAGHVPPILLPPGGDPVVLSAEHGLRVGVPLGVGADLGYDVVEIPVPAGTRIALYTDGLVESPGSDVDAGIAAVASALRGDVEDDLEAVCDRAIAAGVPHAPGRPDDIALLVVQAEPHPADAVVSVELPPDPAAVAGARSLFAETVARWGLADTGVAVAGELLVSEVVTNAIRYAGGRVELTVRRGDAVVYVEVRDGDTRLPRLRHAALDDEGGRGLELVQALSRSWGARPLPDGKVVWFSLEAPQPEQRPEARRPRVRAGA